jgi:hypothetical protein
MPVHLKKHHPALKHGGYAKMAVLPGESLAAFEELHQSLVAEHTPQGAHESHIVARIAQLMWRDQNLPTLRKADYARRRRQQLINEQLQLKSQFSSSDLFDEVDPALREEAILAAEDQLRKELGVAYELLEIGEAATMKGLKKELEVHALLDAMIEKCIKQLAMVRALKYVPATPGSPKLLPGPSKAA